MILFFIKKQKSDLSLKIRLFSISVNLLRSEELHKSYYSEGLP